MHWKLFWEVIAKPLVLGVIIVMLAILITLPNQSWIFKGAIIWFVGWFALNYDRFIGQRK